MKIYESSIRKVGSHGAGTVNQDTVITFGKDVPEALKNFCYIIDIHRVEGEIKQGQTLQIGGQSFRITAVGEVAKRNLEELGHVTFRFNGATEAELPGCIYLEEGKIPPIAEGDKVIIEE